MTHQLHALLGSTALMMTLSSAAAPSHRRLTPPRPAQRDPPAPATPLAHQLPTTKQCPVAPLQAQVCKLFPHMVAHMDYQSLEKGV